ncbi:MULTISPECIES: hypothetical protein [Micromonospora]|uniref:hypothetical protein n=1 Tax=Micromonospora TaxID=1873 RepID=UPI00098D6D9F|nr:MULTISPECIES: hypothetical protein [unclassified Micromonospora]MDI5939090.1 hypothetical protein [Micromonospora sp. DH15]OON27321.1 hypothetical protein BSA16_32635 [Micromonospora sp. Rc5]
MGSACHVRIGHARASTGRQSRDTRLDSPHCAGITRIFSEKISTRAATRPALDQAVHLAQELRASGAAVTLVGHEHKHLCRGLELAALAMLAMALHLRSDEMSLRDIASQLVVTRGKKNNC